MEIKRRRYHSTVNAYMHFLQEFIQFFDSLFFNPIIWYSLHKMSLKRFWHETSIGIRLQITSITFTFFNGRAEKMLGGVSSTTHSKDRLMTIILRFNAPCTYTFHLRVFSTKISFIQFHLIISLDSNISALFEMFRGTSHWKPVIHGPKYLPTGPVEQQYSIYLYLQIWSSIMLNSPVFLLSPLLINEYNWQ